MAAGVGIAIEKGKTGPFARNNEIGLVIIGLGNLLEQISRRARFLRGQKISNTPGGVQLFHSAKTLAREGWIVKSGRAPVSARDCRGVWPELDSLILRMSMLFIRSS